MSGSGVKKGQKGGWFYAIIFIPFGQTSLKRAIAVPEKDFTRTIGGLFIGHCLYDIWVIKSFLLDTYGFVIKARFSSFHSYFRKRSGWPGIRLHKEWSSRFVRRVAAWLAPEPVVPARRLSSTLGASSERSRCRDVWGSLDRILWPAGRKWAWAEWTNSIASKVTWRQPSRFLPVG